MMKPQPEPMAVRELHRIRGAMRAEEVRGGRARFLSSLNQLGEEFARKHRSRWVKAVRPRKASRGRATKPALPSATP